MTQNALAPLARNPANQQIADPANVLVGQFNRQGFDQFTPIYAADSGSGTAYVITPTPGIAKVGYIVGQIFAFKAANANTGTTPTLNVNGFGAGTITKAGGALAVGDIAANAFVLVQCTSTTPTFQLVSPVATASSAVLSGATTFLGSNQTLGTAGTWTNVVNTGSIGANGQTWWISVSATGLCGGGQSFIGASIFNGTSRIISVEGVNPAANQDIVLSTSIVVALTGATTFTLQGTASAVNTSFLTSLSGLSNGAANTATSITAVRIA